LFIKENEIKINKNIIPRIYKRFWYNIMQDPLTWWEKCDNDLLLNSLPRHPGYESTEEVKTNERNRKETQSECEIIYTNMGPTTTQFEKSFLIYAGYIKNILLWVFSKLCRNL